MDVEEVDALVVGGGPAGLSAALWLARHRFRTLVADRGEPRNRWVDATYGYLGYDGAPPTALLDAGRRELARYAEAELVPAAVRTVHRADAHFEAELDDRRVRAAAVVIATGVVDAVPPLEGLQEHYGKRVFVCPLCDGYEMCDRRVAVLGAGGNAGAFGTELLRWASDVIVVPLGEERPSDPLSPPVRLASAPASSMVVEPDGAVEIDLRDGNRVECDAVFLRSEVIGVTDLAVHLGCALNEEGLLRVDDDGRTTVEGVYAVGDCTPGPHLVQVAAAEGARAGLHCAQRLMSNR
jgi:thioredoxin reductase